MVRKVAEGTHRAKIADKERESRRLDNPNCSRRWAQDQGARPTTFFSPVQRPPRD